MKLKQRQIVMDFIKEHFNLEELTLEEFNLLPAGVKITDDNNDHMIFYYDWNTEQVKYMYPENNK